MSSCDAPASAWLFYAEVHLHGEPAPVRRFLPQLVQLIEDGAIFDLTLSLDQAAEGDRAMDERRAIKALLPPGPSHQKAGQPGSRAAC